MTSSEFEDLCLTAKPISVFFDGYIYIKFDNDVEVEISTTTEWDCATFEFDSNLEKEQREIERQKRYEQEVKKNKEFDEKVKRISAKYTAEQLRELEEIFHKK